MTPEDADAHERAIQDQFSRQAVGFAAAPELHADDIRPRHHSHKAPVTERLRRHRRARR
jgi:hypothetical protein